MAMDEWLASVYNTGGTEDLEKTAQYMLLEKMAAEENVDLSGLSPEEIDALAQQLAQDQAEQQTAQAVGGQTPQMGAPQQPQVPQMGGLPGQPPMGQQPEQPGQMGAAGPIDPEQLARAQQILEQHQQWEQTQGQVAPQMEAQIQKEARAKFEEADFLGRVMAHSYTQELRDIASQEKTASALTMPSGLAGVGHHVANAARNVGGAVQGAAQSVGGHMKAHLSAGSSSPLHHVGDAARHVAAHKGAYGAGAAGLGAGYALGSHGGAEKTKTAGEAAIEALANQRAIEILRANGYTI